MADDPRQGGAFAVALPPHAAARAPDLPHVQCPRPGQAPPLRRGAAGARNPRRRPRIQAIPVRIAPGSLPEPQARIHDPLRAAVVARAPPVYPRRSPIVHRSPLRSPAFHSRYETVAPERFDY